MSIMNWQKESSNNPVYPNGTYKVVCQSLERVKASTGTPQIRWKAQITEPPEHAGRIIVDHTALTEKSMWRVAGIIRGFGVDTSNLDNMDTDGSAFEGVCHTCVGRSAYWRNEQGTTPTGSPKNNIVEYIQDQNASQVQVMGEELPDFLK